MNFDWTILQWIQENLRCAALDFLMPKITMLGNSGMIWIAIALVMLCTKKYRKHGIILLVGLLVGLWLFSRKNKMPYIWSLDRIAIAVGIAGALEMGSISVVSVILEPIIEIVISLVLGALSGLALNWLETYFHSRSKRLSLTVAFVLLMVGISSMEFELGGVKIGFSLLLVCMMTGTVFCNVCSASEELMSRLDRWTPSRLLASQRQSTKAFFRSAARQMRPWPQDS